MDNPQKHGTGITWTYWPGTKGETLTTIRGCHWAQFVDAAGANRTFKTCTNCYAQVTAASLVERFNSPHYAGLTKATPRGPVWTGTVRFDEKQLLEVLTATKPRTYFLTSMGDLFFGTDDNTVAYHVAVAILAHWHRFLILTKRPDRMAALWGSIEFWEEVNQIVHALADRVPKKRRRPVDPKFLNAQNIWLGTSIEDAHTAKWALGHLTTIDHPGRLWVSYEPVIEYANLEPWLEQLSWVVIGGASKQGRDPAPPFRLELAQQLIIDCKGTGVPLYLKQLGATPQWFGQEPLVLTDHNNHNDNPEHWPAAFRVQQFPGGK